MILTFLRIMLLRLRNNPLELLLVFVMPVLFFSIFAMIFSQGIASGTEKPVRLVLVIPDETVAARELRESLEQNTSLVCSTLSEETDEQQSGVTLEQRIAGLQNSGRCDVILRLPPGFADDAEETFSVRLITDGQNAMAVAMVTSMLQEFYAKRSVQQLVEQLQQMPRIPPPPAMSQPAVPSVPAVGDVDGAGGTLAAMHEPGDIVAAEQPIDLETWLATGRGELGASEVLPGTKMLTPDSVFQESSNDFPGGPGRESLLTVWDPPRPEANPAGGTGENGTGVQESVVGDPQNRVLEPAGQDAEGVEGAVGADDVADQKTLQIVVENPQAAQQQNPRIAMYAAGIAVLFLLFACTGHAATLLEEAESGTLDRILVSRAGITQIIIGKWAGIFLMGCVQLTVMFGWAELIFRIQLGRHLAGFAIMMACTSAATSSFAMLMATLCRSRAQLNAAATVIILSMSAMGGSMIPRFVMSERMQELGRWTFNAWALDGFQKVFWFQSPLSSLRLEVLVLLGSSAVMGVLTLIFSSRWRRGL